MGSFLDRPKVEKDTHSDSGNGLRAGVSAMQGWRVDMEDAHSMVMRMPDATDYSWFAVFDGHGGSFTSSHAAANMMQKVVDTPEWKSGHREVKNIQAALTKGFLAEDEDLKQVPLTARGEDHSGSTAIVGLVTPTHIIVGNCGDSRSILVRGGNVIEMSADHKPYNRDEQSRIEKAGGTVTMRRVNGDLAVSRALGDFVYKHMTDLKAEEQQVSAEPEIRVQERKDDDQYLVLACDGIWDVMTNEDVAAFILGKAKSGVDDCGQLAAELLDACLEKGSRDNMSAVVVEFKGAPRPTKEQIEAHRQEVEKQVHQQEHNTTSDANRMNLDEADGEQRANDDEEAGPPRVPEDVTPAVGASAGANDVAS